jgi:hypothetical protein
MVLDSVKHTPWVHIGGIIDVIISRWVFLVTGLLLTFSCKQDAGIQKEELYGKWDIVKAMRNGKETPYLRGGYFIIDANGSMTVNITGADEQGPYTFSKNTLRINDDRDFVVQSLRGDSLTVSYTMNENSQFVFYMSKKPDETR